MNISMDDSRIVNITELKAFLTSSKKMVLKMETIDEKYQFINKVIKRFKYHRLSRKEKHIVLVYLKKVTCYRKAQLLRLVKRALKGDLKRTVYVRHNPHIIYGAEDIKLLEITDALHRRLNSVSTKEILRREADLFGQSDYGRISKISTSHINNLRHSNTYREFWVNGTKAREVSIGRTKKPVANNEPGSIRVDTVHQRDVYHINAVDEVIQWEIVVCVPMISERYLLPALNRLLNQFPFIIFNFHSDRGSEFINKLVAKLLNKLLIEQTKSRSRHCNDNALVESKNGSVIRKNMGYTHINFRAAEIISDFYEEWFNPYLNYHRPCLFVTETIKDKKGKEKKVYGQAATPYEKLKEISKLKKKDFLKKGIIFEKLDIIAYQCSDNQFARIMRMKEKQLFDKIEKMIEKMRG